MKTLKEIETRLAAIAQEVETDGADLDALETEARSLKEARQALLDAAEKRNKILADVAGMTGKPAVETPKPTETRSIDGLSRNELIATPEYRVAYLKHLQKQEMTDMERRAWTSAVGSGGAAIPTEMAVQIKDKLYQTAPLLGEVTMNHVQGAFDFPLEDVTSAATSHAEGTLIADSTDTITKRHLDQYEVVKKSAISEAQMKMSASDFYPFVTRISSRSLGHKLTDLIVNGTGSGEATGIEKDITWDGTNSISVAAGGNVTAGNVMDLVGMLNGAYDDNAKFLMSKRTLYQYIKPLQDKSKHDLVYQEGKTHYILGYPVLLDYRMPAGSLYLGDFSEYIVNMAEQINLKTWFDGDYNVYKLLASCLFDGKVGHKDAFVKLSVAQATQATQGT